ncbi:MAG TPA: ECF transporter S component [Candidatus Deferrimicrobium sp.]|nr:ECF transporter S component [Candidatus Deferrimicrobium sp.]
MQKQKSEDSTPTGLKIDSSFSENTKITYAYHQKLSIRIAMISIFAALAIGSSYALAPLINIELMSVLLFIAGFLYGKYVGTLVGLISSLIYYGWNPFGIPPLPLYMVCVALMSFIGLIGGLLKFSPKQEGKIEFTATTIGKFALIGFFYTVLFDILTNIVYAYFYYNGNIMLAFITGLPFMIIHLISNTVIFSLLVIPIYNSVTSI